MKKIILLILVIFALSLSVASVKGQETEEDGSTELGDWAYQDAAVIMWLESAFAIGTECNIGEETDWYTWGYTNQTADLIVRLYQFEERGVAYWLYRYKDIKTSDIEYAVFIFMEDPLQKWDAHGKCFRTIREDDYMWAVEAYHPQNF